MLSEFPLVSAIMPTHNRRDYVPQAIASFLSQTYPNKELIVVDDGQDRVSDLLAAAADKGLVYVGIPERRTIAAKRNLACSHALGEIIMHWDDDDWSAPGRMADQVERLLESRAPMTGYHTMVFLDQEREEAWRYASTLPAYGIGTSLCYLASYWQAVPFPSEIKVGEDEWIVRKVPKLVSVDAGDLMFARIHTGNTSDKRGSVRDPRTGESPAEWSRLDYRAALARFAAVAAPAEEHACV